MGAIFDTTLHSRQPLACRLFEAAIARNHLANAYLLTGSATADKFKLSQYLAAALNCRRHRDADGTSCLVWDPDDTVWCRECQWIHAGKHPGVLLTLAGAGKSQKIPVEAARLASEELARESPYVRLVLVPEAEESIFHRPAANCLLKRIEEPPVRCLFLFFAGSASEVLPTIESRCQVVPVNNRRQLGPGLAIEPPARRSCSPGESPDTPSETPELRTLLEEAISVLETQVQTLLSASAHAGPGWKQTHAALAFARLLSDYAGSLSEHASPVEAAQLVVDAVACAELNVWRRTALVDQAASGYIASVVANAEEAKRQLSYFIKPVNVFETLSFALIDIRLQQSGEPYLAKHRALQT